MYVSMGAQMETRRLGLTVVAVVQNPTTDACVYVLRGRGRIVIAFRGTATGKNVRNDLKGRQVPLPEMGAGTARRRARAAAGDGSSDDDEGEDLEAADLRLPPPSSAGEACARCLRGMLRRLPLLQQAMPCVHRGFWESYESVRVKVRRRWIRAR